MIDPKFHMLSNAKLATLLDHYSQIIQMTNEQEADRLASIGADWADEFIFQPMALPRGAFMTELTRMEAWMIAHRAEIDAAVAEAKAK